jgi:protein disulfide-isomerase
MEYKGDIMVHSKHLLKLVPLVFLAGALFAADQPPYDETADAHQQVASAIAEASKAQKNVILVFGANWCGDCRALDAQMHKDELAALIASNYEVVKIDVGRFNKNKDIAAKYRAPLAHGIPTLAVLDPAGNVLYAMDQGQFSNARSMSYESIRDFFVKWAPKK